MNTTTNTDNTIPDADAGLRLALETGATTADAGSRVTYIEITEAGTTFKVPVVIAPAGEGKMAITPLLDTQKAAIAFARQERLLTADGPDRREGTAKMQALDSFVAFVERNKNPDSAVWADATGRNLVAVIDYNEQGAEGAARWGKHRAVYPCPLSEAWTAWGGGAEKKLDQEEFAKFLDAHDRELTDGILDGRSMPTPAALVTMANKLETFAQGKARRVRDAATGRLSLSMSLETGTSDETPVPASFLIQIPIFQDSAPARLEVRLRLDVNKDGDATFTLRIQAGADVLRAAFTALVEVVGAKTTLPVFIGSPE